MKVLKNFIADEDGIQVTLFTTDQDTDGQVRLKLVDIDADELIALFIFPAHLNFKAYSDFQKYKRSFN